MAIMRFNRELIRENWAFILLAFAVFAINFNMGITQSVQTNFFKQDLGMVGTQMGIMTAGREFTGFIIVAVAALTMRFAPAKVAAASILLMALGYGGYASVQSFPHLMVVVVIGGMGFHGWLQLYFALGLSLAKPGQEGRIMGRLSSIGSVGTLVAMAITYLIVNTVTMRGMFVVSAFVIVLGGLGLFLLPPLKGAVRQQSFVLKRQYWLYYLLQFLEGCRFEIFQTFALFALVDVYGVDVQTITLLLIFNAITNWYVAPIFGKLVDTRGERWVLTLTYVMHTLAFTGFALVHNVWFLYAMYVLVRIFMVAGMSINTYIRKIAEPKDLSTSLAMGVSASHMAAIVIPITGGILWQTFGYEISFAFGVFFVVLSLYFAQKIRITDYRPEYQALHAAAASGRAH